MAPDLSCRCSGLLDAWPRCKNQADQEDGLCSDCRCDHGGCGDHPGTLGLLNCRATDPDRERMLAPSHADAPPVGEFREARIGPYVVRSPGRKAWTLGWPDGAPPPA